MRVTYQLGARFASALKGAIEKEAADEVGVKVSVKIGEVSELTFDGVQNPSAHIQEFAALYGIGDPLKVNAVGRGVYSVELGENRIAPYLEDTDMHARPKKKRARRGDVEVLHDNLFESAGSEAVDKDLYAVFA